MIPKTSTSFPMAFQWMPSHLTEEDVAAGHIDQWRWQGNRRADEAATEASVAKGDQVIGVLLDMSAFYDNIDLETLLLDGTKHGFSASGLILAIEMYLAPRYCSKYGSFASAAIPYNSIVAGCSKKDEVCS